jgi:hypothetical protein
MHSPFIISPVFCHFRVTKKSNQMKKVFLATALIAASAFSVLSVNAQDVKGKHFVNAGIGIGTFGFSGTGGVPVTASYEHGFTDKISAGVYVGIIKRKWYDDLTYNYKVIGVRGSYHFNELLNVDIPKLDVYGGISLYYRGYVVKYDSPINGKNKTTSGGMDVGFHAAARYMLTKNVGGFAEVGYGVSPLQIGATFVF